MINNNTQHRSANAFGRNLFVGALMLACALGSTKRALGQSVTPPPTPALITPSSDQTAFLVGHALGTQGYTCLPTPTGGTSWTVNPPRPEATLFTEAFGQLVQIITHFASINEAPNLNGTNPPSVSGNATWQAFDTSRVWAKVTGSILGGSDPASCPNAGAIPCVLLESIGNEKGPSGGRLLARTTSVQRLNTNGGSAPTSACTVGQTQLVPYTADYYFFHKDN